MHASMKSDKRIAKRRLNQSPLLGPSSLAVPSLTRTLGSKMRPDAEPAWSMVPGLPRSAPMTLELLTINPNDVVPHPYGSRGPAGTRVHEVAQRGLFATIAETTSVEILEGMWIEGMRIEGMRIAITATMTMTAVSGGIETLSTGAKTGGERAHVMANDDDDLQRQCTTLFDKIEIICKRLQREKRIRTRLHTQGLS